VGLFGHQDVSPDEALRRAEAIRNLAGSEAFRWLVEAAVTDAHLDWENAKTKEAREAAFTRLEGIRSLDRQIEKIVGRGVAAAKQIARERKALEKLQ